MLSFLISGILWGAVIYGVFDLNVGGVLTGGLQVTIKNAAIILFLFFSGILVFYLSSKTLLKRDVRELVSGLVGFSSGALLLTGGGTYMSYIGALILIIGVVGSLITAPGFSKRGEINASSEKSRKRRRHGAKK